MPDQAGRCIEPQCVLGRVIGYRSWLTARTPAPTKASLAVPTGEAHAVEPPELSLAGEPGYPKAAAELLVSLLVPDRRFGLEDAASRGLGGGRGGTQGVAFIGVRGPAMPDGYEQPLSDGRDMRSSCYA